VDMVFQHNVSEEDQAIVILEELPGLQQNLHSVGAGKDGEPANDRTRQEMGEGAFSEPIAVRPIRLGSIKEATRSVEDGIPTRERGNE
jgi:hypothetical protein